MVDIKVISIIGLDFILQNRILMQCEKNRMDMLTSFMHALMQCSVAVTCDAAVSASTIIRKSR